MRLIALSIIGIAATLGISSQVSLAAQSTPSAAAAQGKRLFLRCASCHAITLNAPPRIGPNLFGVAGRKAGSLPGANYSAAMKRQTFAWDDATLDRWLTRPSDVVPGTSMAFAGISKPQDRAALIAYLKNPQ